MQNCFFLHSKNSIIFFYLMLNLFCMLCPNQNKNKKTLAAKKRDPPNKDNFSWPYGYIDVLKLDKTLSYISSNIEVRFRNMTHITFFFFFDSVTSVRRARDGWTLKRACLWARDGMSFPHTLEHYNYPVNKTGLQHIYLIKYEHVI